MTMIWLLLISSALAQTSDSSSNVPAKSPAVQSPQAAMREALEQQKASIAKQQQAVRQQAQTAGVRLTPWESAALVEAACDPIAESDVAPLIEKAAKTNKLEPKLIRAVIEKESGFRPCAVSPKGAQGLMQIMPATAGDLGIHDVFDPGQNIDAGARFLRQLLDKFGGDLAKTLGAYNAGPAAVDAIGAIPAIPETQDYVDSIMKGLVPKRTVPPSIPTPKPIGN
jgi:soluble lytic murein transglycosylase-like protein